MAKGKTSVLTLGSAQGRLFAFCALPFDFALPTAFCLLLSAYMMFTGSTSMISERWGIPCWSQ
jgi:uncharacterized membrane protein YkvI